MRTLKALALIVAALLFILGTRFETYHYQGSFWTLNRYTGSKRLHFCRPLPIVIARTLRRRAADVLPLVHHLVQQDRDDELVVLGGEDLGIRRQLSDLAKHPS